ncbi:hypothetical protein M153_127720002, partial [Pseudoloma neurophilia]
TVQGTDRPSVSSYPKAQTINSQVPRPSLIPDISNITNMNVSNASVTPNQQNATVRPKRPSYADIMSNAANRTVPQPGQLNMQQPDNPPQGLPPRPGRAIPMPPTQFNRSSQTIDSAPQRFSPRPSVYDNPQPSHDNIKNIAHNTGYPVQRSSAHPPSQNSNLEKLSDDEKIRINNLVSEVIAYVKSEAMKKKSIVYRSRIKDGLTKLQNYSEIKNENDLNLLKNLGNDMKENLCIIERVHGALSECRSWVDGIIALYKVIKA